MQARFLLGPAGSGKTFRCLEEIRAELLKSPEGPPLLLLAPKQATFQLERQLLADAELPGYTRLQILSFERLAQFVLEEFAPAPPRLLGDEGRLMVLRALLAQKEQDLKLFRASARLPGFAQQLSLLLRELQRHQLASERLLAWASQSDAASQLHDKLHDIALLLRAYLDWLQKNKLQDANYLLDLATQTLRAPVAGQQQPSIHFAGLWLDGFAEMTPQELNFLAALIPQCEQATLAFCLEQTLDPDCERSWLSTGSVVAQTVRRCQTRFAALPHCQVTVEQLPRDPNRSRFSESPALAHLEQHWSQPQAYAPAAAELRLAVCANPEAEAMLAAQEIMRHVRGGGRYRECAVLARSLEGCHDVVRRVFTRYDIPFFLDRREPVAHHPLAELTRFALRTAAFGWRQEDWFGALKSGLVRADEMELDQLENEALARGWEGRAAWQQPLRFDAETDASLVRDLETLRQRLVPPFLRLADALTSGNHRPTGAQLAAALRAFWREMDVAAQLDEWSSPPTNDLQSAPGHQPSAIHRTVYQQMSEWLGHLDLAFAAEPLALRDWLPILEAGLGGLSVGVIPPVLDEVLIGAIDRSRNPDLQLAIVLGVNEAVFPAPPASGVLLTDADREALAALDPAHFFLGPDARQRLGHERYLGYIACTRARRRLVLTCAAFNEADKKLNPSPFFAHLQRLFPSLEMEEWRPAMDWLDSEHLSDLIAPLLQSNLLLSDELSSVADWPILAPLRARLNHFTTPGDNSLPPALAEKLYGPDLRTSVTRLEKFAECPFRFFVHSGLRAQERKRFDADVRATGQFQHEILKQFHEQLRGENKRWRDISPAEARQRVRQIADELLPVFDGGVLFATERDRFTARLLAAALEDFIETLVGWLAQYEFDPVVAELRFSDHGGDIPAWKLPLAGGRQLVFQGVIDRVDLHIQPDRATALCVVMDYKSSAKKIDARLLANGVQLQLPAYLSVLRQLADPQKAFGVAKLIPAGVFYVSLRGQYTRGANRDEVFADERARTLAYRHSGRFDASELEHFDNRPQPPGEAQSGDQFNYTLTAKTRELHKRSSDPMPRENFLRLLDTVETQLKQMGERIFAGEAKVDPYQHGAKKPCEFCDYRSVCRIDPWSHAYRALKESAQ